VARDRKRAKQRRARRGRGVAPAAPGAGQSALGQPVREDLPGALGHASGDVDEFDAALVRGAGGVPVSSEAVSDLAGKSAAEDRAEDDLLEEPGGEDGADGDGAVLGTNGAAATRAPGAPLQEGNRALAFLRASWAELQRVQWPDRRHVSQATAVVLGFVAIAGLYLGLADYVAKEIVEFVVG
jgi:preprotein translocase SecE subunit